jgi:hypothetical protein
MTDRRVKQREIPDCRDFPYPTEEQSRRILQNFQKNLVYPSMFLDRHTAVDNEGEEGDADGKQQEEEEDDELTAILETLRDQRRSLAKLAAGARMERAHSPKNLEFPDVFEEQYVPRRVKPIHSPDSMRSVVTRGYGVCWDLVTQPSRSEYWLSGWRDDSAVRSVMYRKPRQQLADESALIELLFPSRVTKRLRVMGRKYIEQRQRLHDALFYWIEHGADMRLDGMIDPFFTTDCLVDGIAKTRQPVLGEARERLIKLTRGVRDWDQYKRDKKTLCLLMPLPIDLRGIVFDYLWDPAGDAYFKLPEIEVLMNA